MCYGDSSVPFHRSKRIVFLYGIFFFLLFLTSKPNLKLQNHPTVAMQPPRSAERHGPPSSGVRPLSERQLKNQRKRVHLHSKRLRQLWPTIASYLDLQSAVALASSCRRLQVVLRDETVWCVRGAHSDCVTLG